LAEYNVKSIRYLLSNLLTNRQEKLSFSFQERSKAMAVDPSDLPDGESSSNFPPPAPPILPPEPGAAMRADPGPPPPLMSGETEEEYQAKLEAWRELRKQLGLDPDFGEPGPHNPDVEGDQPDPSTFGVPPDIAGE
jgi:hypothetical protein